MVSYLTTSQQQREQLLLATRQALQERFPSLLPEQWQQAVEQCQPELWIDADKAYVEAQSLTRLGTWIALAYGSSEEEPEVYTATSLYLARKLNSYIDAIQQVLVTSQEQTGTSATGAYLALLRSLCQQDVIAQQVQEVFSQLAEEPQLPRKQLFLVPEATSHVQSKATNETLASQWITLRNWFGQQDDPLRSWNLAALSRTLHLPQSVVKRLLLEPTSDPAQQPMIFTQERLLRVQRLLLPYGFDLSS